MKKRKFPKKLLSAAAVLTLSIQTVLPHVVSCEGASSTGKATGFSFTNEQIRVSKGSYSGYEINGTSLTIKKSGTYTVSGNCNNGTISIQKGTTDVTLILDQISLISSDTAPICCNKSSKVSVIAKEGTVNSLADTESNNDDKHPNNSNAENAVIKCKDGSNVTIGGAGTINITANGKNGIKSGASTNDEGDASLTIEDVTLQITAPVNDALNAESLLAIKSGKLNISAADDAIHCDRTLTIGEKDALKAPDIDISSCYEGLEGANVTIYSGDIDIHATDDGINAANSDLTNYDFSLVIAGGDIYVDTTSGDGLDSNGTLTISGGKTEVFSTSNADNAPLDSDGALRITGGTVFAVGNGGMAQNPSSGSQNYLIFGASRAGGQPGGQNRQQGAPTNGQQSGQTAGQAGQNPTSGQQGNPQAQAAISISADDTLSITDSSNTAIYTSAAVRSANYIFYSDSSLSEKETYTLNINGNAAAESTITNSMAQSGSTPPTNNGPGNPPSAPEPGNMPGNSSSAPAPGNAPGNSSSAPAPGNAPGNSSSAPAPGNAPGNSSSAPTPGNAPENNPSAPPSGNAPGNSSSAPSSYNAANTCSSDTTFLGQTLSSTGTDENAVLVTGGNVTMKNSSLSRVSADSTGGDHASFYGTGAAALVTDGKLYMKDCTINTDANGGAGVFAYNKGEAYIADTKISTTKDTAGGIHAAGGGTLYAWDLAVTTQGNSSAAIRSDRGGGKMVVDGGSYVSNGTGSPAVYCTADIAVNNSTLSANRSEAVCIEGLNSLSLYNSALTGAMQDDTQNDTTWTVIVYQSMSGDSQIGCGKFTMKDGKLISKNGGLFYTTNTESEFYLENVTITSAEDSEFFLQCTGNNNARGWGTAGSNGAQCRFTAANQEMTGDIIWDAISTLDFYITQGSALKGAVRKSTDNSSGNGYAKLYISADASWIVTGDSVVTDLYCAGKIMDVNGKTVSITGSDGTVYVNGDSAYTVTVNSYSTNADLSNAVTAKSWSVYAVDKPSYAETSIDLSTSAKIALSKTKYVYNGKKKTPAITVQAGSVKLTEHTDYTITYKNNTDVGTASVIITGTGNYTGKVTKTFMIVPKGTSIAEVKAKTNGFTVKWKKPDNTVTGYQIQYSPNQTFAKNKTVTKTVKKASVTKLTAEKLTADQKYYVRVRVYKTVNGKKYTSGWSKAKSVTTK